MVVIPDGGGRRGAILQRLQLGAMLPKLPRQHGAIVGKEGFGQLRQEGAIHHVWISAKNKQI